MADIEAIANLDAEIPDSFDDPPAPAEKPADKPDGDDAKDAAASLADDGEPADKPKKPQKAREADEGEAGDEGEADDDDEGEDKPPTSERTKITAEGTYEIDGKEVKGKDLLKERMMHSDYSRKRASESQAVREAEQKVANIQSEKAQFQGFWKKLTTDSEFMRDVLEERAPEIFQRMLYAVGAEAQELQDLPEGERAAKLELRDLKRSQRRADRENGERQARDQQAQQSAHQKAMTAKYREWLPAAMKDHGLEIAGNDGHNQEVRDMIADRVQRMFGRGRDYSQEEIGSAAQAVSQSSATRALLAQNGQADVGALVETLGADKVAAILKHEAEKLQGKGKPDAPREPGERKPAKKKPKSDKGNSTDFFNDLDKTFRL